MVWMCPPQIHMLNHPKSDGNIKVASLGSAWIFLNTNGICSHKNFLYTFENCFHFRIITIYWLYSLCILEHPEYAGSVVSESGLALPHMDLSFLIRDWTHIIPYTGKWILNHWTTKEVPSFLKLRMVCRNTYGDGKYANKISGWLTKFRVMCIIVGRKMDTTEERHRVSMFLECSIS